MSSSRAHEDEFDGVDGVTLRKNGSLLSAAVLRRCIVYVSSGGPEDIGKNAKLEGGAVVIGRDESCQLALGDKNISRRHLRISAAPDGFLVEDLGSTNGVTYLDRRIERAVLPLGSRISVGDCKIDLLPIGDDRTVPLSRRSSYGHLLGMSVQMRRLFTILETLEKSDAPVLIEGETGTGKELVASALHQNGRRADKPFVVIDCGNVPAELMESELFGYRRGAFTGAVTDRPGAFEVASGGTVFLDELGELPLSLQPKLLRVLETGQVKRLGDVRHQAVDVRIIAATKRNLASEVAAGRFRDDLFFRVAVVQLVLPPLRDRREDILFLARALLRQLSQGEREAVPVELEETWLQHDWPGNVRELRNAVHQILALQQTGGGWLPPGAALRLDEGLPSEMGSEKGRPGDVLLDARPKGKGPAGARTLEEEQGGEEALDKRPQGEGTLGAKESKEGALSFGSLMGMPYAEARQQALISFEQTYLRDLWSKAGGSMAAAARISGMDKAYLRRLLRKHGLHE
ncbi:MAG: sigma 54-interacting transcriptional regulator [Polyangia bacterium]|jgi:transcriptional regulator with GAF, ATPase, and Fis domain|nr:sigma 54-interacting transcriptional regulator [Polyangia bacterium]